MIFTNSWKSRLPSPSLSAALINIITSSSVSTSPGGWLWASKTKSSWKQRQGQRQRPIQKQRQNQQKIQRQILTNVSHEVFELSGLHGAAAIFVQGAERQSHLVVIVLIFLAWMLYCYRQASQKSWSLKWQHFSPLLYRRRRSSCGSSCYRTPETRSDPSHPCRTAGEVEMRFL